MRRVGKIFLGGFVVLAAIPAIRIPIARSFDAPLAPPLATIGKLPVTLPSGQAAMLKDEVRPGLPTIVALWASWCEPCQLEEPKLAELRHRFGPAKLNMVYVNVRDPYALREDLEAYMTRFSLPPDGYVVLDEGRLRSLTNDPQKFIPRVLIFNSRGQPIATIIGYKPWALDRVAGLVGS